MKVSRDKGTMKFKQITIIGVGLIGGSIGLAVKKKGLASRVIGVTAHKKSLKKARKRGAIDTGTLNVKNSVLGSDMVILATPVDKILNVLKKVRPCLEKGCIVIDVGSVKGMVVETAEKIVGRKAYFIGTHPMAGSEQKGIGRANSSLFKNTPSVITKTGKTNARALRLVSGFWKAMGSKVYILSPCEHDKKISSISHLPHIVASALSLTARSSSMEFASTGFKDTTRIASGDPDLWMSILMANRGNVRRDVKDYMKRLQGLRDSIACGKKGRLKKMLSSAKKKRDASNIKGRDS